MSFTVTAAQTVNVSPAIALKVVVLTGAATVQPGRVTSFTALTGLITPEDTGSIVYGTLSTSSSIAFTANGNTTLDANVSYAGGQFGALKSSTTTSSGVGITLGSTTGSGNPILSLCEIIAAGTITEDASTPAAVSASALSVTTAAFSPPLGALLVALWTYNSNGSLGTPTVTDTSGLGLTWTVQDFVTVGGFPQYAAVWTAQMPPGTSPVYPAKGPVRARPPLPAPGRTQSHAGFVQGTGPRFYPSRKPVAATVRVLAPRGRVAQGTPAYVAPLPPISGKGWPYRAQLSPIPRWSAILLDAQ